MSAFIIRPAEAADLQRVFDLWYHAEVAHAAQPPEQRSLPAVCQHELETGRMLVAQQDGQVVGFVTLLIRGSIAIVAKLFVDPGTQSTHVGTALLAAALQGVRGTVCTISSSDPRAHALYLRTGMKALWPIYLLTAPSARYEGQQSGHIDIVEARPDDSALQAWDREVSGMERSVDQRYWLSHAQASALWFRHGGRTLGYGYIQLSTDESLWYTDAITVGPVGARTPEDAVACVRAAIAWAQLRGELVRLLVPGPHPALGPLLSAQFHIGFVDTFMCSDLQSPANPGCYIPSGYILL